VTLVTVDETLVTVDETLVTVGADTDVGTDVGVVFVGATTSRQALLATGGVVERATDSTARDDADCVGGGMRFPDIVFAELLPIRNDECPKRKTLQVFCGLRNLTTGYSIFYVK
jgi:hypothetical protein